MKTEIIDLGHPENVCSGLPNYPIALEGASGGLLGDKYPVVCGGLDYSTYEYVSDCIVLGNYNQNWIPRNIQYSLKYYLVKFSWNCKNR